MSVASGLPDDVDEAVDFFSRRRRTSPKKRRTPEGAEADGATDTVSNDSEDDMEWRRKIAKQARKKADEFEKLAETKKKQYDKAMGAYKKALMKRKAASQAANNNSDQFARRGGVVKGSAGGGKRHRGEERVGPLERLTTSLKQKPLFVFAKYVAGFAGMSNLEMLFDELELNKEVTNITMMSYGPLMIAALSDAGSCLDRACLRNGIYPIKYPDIIVDGTHELYEPFARLTAYYLRSAISNKPASTISTRHNYFTLLQTTGEESVFESFVANSKLGSSYSQVPKYPTYPP